MPDEPTITAAKIRYRMPTAEEAERERRVIARALEAYDVMRPEPDQHVVYERRCGRAPAHPRGHGP